MSTFSYASRSWRISLALFIALLGGLSACSSVPDVERTEARCDNGTAASEWPEQMLLVEGTARGCVDGSGIPTGPVVISDEDENQVARGQYTTDGRSGVWHFRYPIEHEQNHRPIANRDGEFVALWVEGDVAALVGPRLWSEFSSEGPTAADDGTSRPRRPDVKISKVEIERLSSLDCRSCASYYIALDREGVVEFVGYAGTVPLGPRTGELEPDLTSLIFRMASRLDWEDRMEVASRSHNYPVTVRLSAEEGQDHVTIAMLGTGQPELAADLATIVDFAARAIDFSASALEVEVPQCEP